MSNEIRASLPLERCPYCKQLLINNKCANEGCIMKLACDNGYSFPTKIEQYPVIEME